MSARILFAAVCAAALAAACSGPATAPQTTDAQLAGPSPDAPQPARNNVPPPPADPLAVGTQEAKDDL